MSRNNLKMLTPDEIDLDYNDDYFRYSEEYYVSEEENAIQIAKATREAMGIYMEYLEHSLDESGVDVSPEFSVNIKESIDEHGELVQERIGTKIEIPSGDDDINPAIAIGSVLCELSIVMSQNHPDGFDFFLDILDQIGHRETVEQSDLVEYEEHENPLDRVDQHES